MFLIEYEEGSYINGEMINYIDIDKESIEFTLAGDNESIFRVCKDHQQTFINHLQALNGNISSVEAKYHSVTNGE